MRIFSAALLLLAACGVGADETAVVAGEESDCALDGAAAFTAECRTESTRDGWIVHHPDGGFRRIKVEDDGRFTTDGAEAVHVLDGGVLAIGDDRYALAQ